MDEPRILLVEDRDSLRRMLERALAGEGFPVVAVADGEEALRRLDAEAFALVLTDLRLPGAASGLDVLAASRRRHAETPVVVLTAFGSVATAVEAMKLGAADFLEKPVELDDLFPLVRSLLARPGPGEEGGPGEGQAFRAGPETPPIVGSHPRLRAALRLLERVAATETTVLLTGESGTGKELFARALHDLSPRRTGPFVAVNCAAIPESLIESELFGHERGAFTGAHRRQPGRFERARGGTLLLDEIGELPAAVQGKVLRVLEERTYERVGGGSERVDARIVAATNRDLREMVASGAFRSDLFFRLDVFPIHLPALRERPQDVAPLARHLLARHAERHGLAPPVLGETAAGLLAEQPWPGNVRQLANVLERVAILHPGERLSERELAPLLAGPSGPDPREEVRRALRDAAGDKRRAAELLGVSYRTLQRRVRELDLEGYPKYRE